MLLNDFYSVTELNHTTGALKATIRLNPDHEIFKGHFPGYPVVPGVCMLEIIRELLEERLKKKFFLKSALNVKFLSVINPEQNNGIEVTVTYSEVEDGLVVNAVLFEGNTVFFKLVNATLQST